MTDTAPTIAAGSRPRILPQQPVTTRDGVALIGDVFLPSEAESSPTVLVRTPYGRSQPLLLQLAAQLRAAGLSVLLQDCRGRFRSGGEVDLQRERDDTEDTVDWTARQPWNDGTVGFFGMSISSLQFFPVAARPPAGVEVRAMVNLMGARDLRSMIYRNGALQLHWALPWFHLISSNGNAWQSRPWHELYRHLPLDSVPENGFDLSRWREALASPRASEHWTALDASRWLPEIGAPTLTVSGWHDFMLDQALDAYEAMSAAAPGRHKLIVGPWDHQSLLGNFSRAPVALQKSGALDLTRIVVSWFQRWLLPDAADASARAWDRHPGVSFFVLGAGRWIAADGYPLAEARVRELYLASRGDAATAAGGGRLVAAPPAAGEDEFEFRPADPVPTLGGAIWPFAAVGLRPGSLDQRTVERRPDVLVYTGDPLEDELTVAGPIEVSLYASTSAADTDFTAKLVDVEPDGTARIVQDGVVRASHTVEVDGGGPLAAGATRRWRIPMPATAYLFKAGHRVRLEISSSNFPKYDRCVAGDDPAGEVHRQRVSHGGSRPSSVRLAVLPKRRRDKPYFPLGSLDSGDLSGRGRLLTLERIGAVAQRVMRPVMSQFGKPSGAFGRIVGRLLAFYNRELNATAISHLDVQPTDYVLEIGFGPGRAIERLAELAARGRVVGIDHSDVMVRVAGERNAAAIRQGRIELRHASVDDMGLPPRSFDRALAVNAIQAFPAPVEALRSIREVLKDGGRLVIARQPRGETTSSDRVYEMASRIAQQMRDAGFGSVRTMVRSAKPVDIACVIGTRGGGGSSAERESSTS